MWRYTQGGIQGASLQAGTVEELVNSMEDISLKVSANAGTAANASKMAFEVGKEAEESDRRMHELLSAMDDINTASREIRRIIKTIEDIAFQTNILFLNVSVEKSIESISEASDEQANSVVQIKQGIKEISDIIQVNSATAEESAAVSEELSAQALFLKELIGKFRIKDEE